MSGPFGEPTNRPKPARGAEWEKTDRPGVWRNRDTGRIETWFDSSGKPRDGEPPSQRPAVEDDSAFIIC